MSRFEDFYEKEFLIEKVSKREINDALANKNILVGAEFEFIMDDFGQVGSSEDYDNAYKAWQQFNTDVHTARAQYEEINEDMWKEEKKIDQLKERLDNEQLALDAGSSEVDRYETLMKELEEAPEDHYRFKFGGKRKFIAKSKKSQQTAIRDFAKQEGVVALLDDEITQREQELENRQDTYLDDIDWPVIDEAYDNYMEDFGLGQGEIFVFSIVAEGEPLPDEPPDNSDMMDSSAEGIERHMEESGMLKDIPFSNYEFGEYGSITQRVGDTLWAIENDSSLDDGGVEVKSPPMPLPDFMKMLPKVLSWIKKHGHTVSDTGMHVHMSIKNVPSLTTDTLDRMKMILFMDEGFIWNSFSDRLQNQWVTSVKDKLKSSSTITKDVSKLFDPRKMALRLSTAHEDAINFQHISKGHVEYRYLGGRGYESKLGNLTASIGHFAHNLSLGFDPEFKKKEYAMKLRRVFNKMELYKLTRKIGFMELRLKEIKNKYKGDQGDLRPTDEFALEKQLVKWQKEEKIWQKIYKIDNNTRRHLGNNSSYVQSIFDDYKKDLKKILSKDGIMKMNVS